MRLFIGVDFSEELKSQLADIAGCLKKVSCSGNFTLKENFHLTLAFLGELPQSSLAILKKVMDDTPGEDFSLYISGLGSFKRPEGDIYWLGMHTPPALLAYRRSLNANLETQGFPVDKRAFRPHLTLGRQIVLSGQVNGVGQEELFENVEKITLFSSSRVNGKLTYTSLYQRLLGASA